MEFSHKRATSRRITLLSLEHAAPLRRFVFDGDAYRLRLVSEALRIRFAHLFDPFLAVRSSRIDPMPHQLSAVYEDMLPRQSLRFLLADDPGAGKTVMAGLLIKELLIRADLERCLIVAPGNLVEQWQDELHDKFALDFEILTRDQIEASPAVNIFSRQRRLIARLDMLARSPDLQERIKAAEPWDLIVCDEAHRMSASFFGTRINATKRYRLGELLGARCRHFLLMTATPHNGKEEDFQLFMRLLDADRFAGRYRPGMQKENISGMMRRLTKEDLRGFDGRPLFPPRQATTVAYELSETEAALYEATTRYVREEMNRADRIADANDRRRNNIGFALQILQRRLASSPKAIHESLKRRIARLQTRLDAGGDWQKQEYDKDFDDDPEDELGEEEERIVDEATAARTLAELQSEIDSLKRLEELARALLHSREDAKWRQLDEILNAPEVQDRKLVIFTEARDTLEYLVERIRQRVGDAQAVVFIHGGVSRERRRAAIAEFNDDPRTRFLIANDAAGEGVNLQRGAHLMVNYDLPWNPNRLEQRFGRIHRIGQQHGCHLWNLVAANTREGAVYARLLEKMETARARLGGKYYDVLGELLEARPLRDMLMDAIRHGDSEDIQNRLFDAIDAATDHERIKRAVAESKLSEEGLDPSSLTGLKEDMERAEARRLQPHYIRSFFTEAFAAAGGVMHRRERGRYEIRRVPPALRAQASIESVEPLLPRYERICFDKDAILADTPDGHQAVLVAPGHPLLDASVEWTLQQYSDLLQRGAILVDENDSGIEPHVLVYLSHSLRDGCEREISRRLQFVHIDRHNRKRDGGPAPYLDCRPLAESEKPLVAELLAEDWLANAADIENEARAHAESQLIPRHVRAIKPRRLAEIDRIEKAVKKRLRQEIWHSSRQDGKRQAQDEQESARRADPVAELAARMNRRLAELEKARQITPLPPQVLGAALIVPQGWLDARHAASAAQPLDCGFAEADVDDESTAEARAIIEKLAMDAVMAEERALGRIPRDVSAENRGYDIESRDPHGEKLTCIEVKGRSITGSKTDISLTHNEIRAAFNTKEAYILAVVRIRKGHALRPDYIRNPAAKIFINGPAFAETKRDFALDKILNFASKPH